MTLAVNTFLLIVVSLFTLACQRPLVHLRGQTMGTTYSIKYLEKEGAPNTPLIGKEVERVLLEIDLLASNYRPDSIIAALNLVPSNVAFEVGAEFVERLNVAKDIHMQSEGAFDPTIGPLVNLWGFGKKESKRIPSEEEIALTLKKVGLEKLLFSGTSVTKKVDDMFIDLNAQAPGYAVDRLAYMLENHQITDYMIEIGGEIRTRGKGPDGVWKIGIESPQKESGPVIRVVPLQDSSMATSGDYRHFFEKKGHRYSHTINRSTGRPVENDVTSVTVIISDTCERADAYATALLALGSIKGSKLAEDKKLAAFFILRDGQNPGRFLLKTSSTWNQKFGAIKE